MADCGLFLAKDRDWNGSPVALVVPVFFMVASRNVHLQRRNCVWSDPARGSVDGRMCVQKVAHQAARRRELGSEENVQKTRFVHSIRLTASA